MEGPTPRVSLIIPSYNAALYLPALCRSLQAQTFRDFEVLIGDDASTDDTRQALEPFLVDERFRYLRWDRNRGATFGTVFLLGQARGEFWGYPGADDVLEPRFLEERVGFMEQHPEVGLVFGRPRLMDETGSELPITWERSSTWMLPWPERDVMDAAAVLPLLLQHNVVSAPGILIRMAATRIVMSSMPVEWLFAMDLSFWILHASSGYMVGFDGRPLHWYRIVGSSLSHHPAKLAMRRAEIRLVPLWALSRARAHSIAASVVWGRWGRTLYALWLRRAWVLHRAGALQDAWLQLAAQAYYGSSCGHVSLGAELVRHSWRILLASIRETSARRRQALQVSGLAQVDHPLFRKS